MENLYCYHCNKKVVPEIRKKTNEYVVHNRSFEVEEETYYCSICEEELLGDNLNHSLNNIYNQYLQMYHLNLESFKRIRNSYNLSQELFAKALGWSKKTVTRYETGQSLPQREYLNVYAKLKENPSELIDILNKNKDQLKDQYYFILGKIPITYDLKTINTFLYILNKIPLYTTQIMKYLFALDFQSYKEINHPITNFKYVHATYGPIINSKDEILNYLIQNKYLKMIPALDDKIQFIANKECDLKFFDSNEIAILDKVISKLRDKTSTQLSNWSHQFKGWINTQNGNLIDFKYASEFDLEKGFEKPL